MKRERGGITAAQKLSDRGNGKTEQWEVTQKLFDFHSKRLGFSKERKSSRACDRSSDATGQQASVCSETYGRNATGTECVS